MTEDTTLEITRLFDAPAAEVFDAWVTPEQWQSWIAPEGVACAVVLLEPHVGGRHRAENLMPDGRVIAVVGVYKVVDRPNALSFTWGWESDASRQSLISVALDERDGQTMLAFRQEGLASVSSRESHRQGWGKVLTKLSDFLAREKK
jgi:uncharacterized protein YndB with AHSA1/START domain